MSICPTLCPGGCGFYGSARTQGYCSSCFKKFGTTPSINAVTGAPSSISFAPLSPGKSVPTSSPSTSSSAFFTSATAGTPSSGIAGGLSSASSSASSALYPNSLDTYSLNSSNILGTLASQSTSSLSSSAGAAGAAAGVASTNTSAAGGPASVLSSSAISATTAFEGPGSTPVRDCSSGDDVAVSGGDKTPACLSSPSSSSAIVANGASGSGDDGTSATPSQKNRSRCLSCKKKVGLVGFECRCGFIFCGVHRYPDQHTCSFDYLSHDRKILEARNTKAVADKHDGDRL